MWSKHPLIPATYPKVQGPQLVEFVRVNLLRALCNLGGRNLRLTIALKNPQTTSKPLFMVQCDST